MTRRERLMASLRGEPVDRPPVSFYEIDGFTQNPENDDPFNNYSGPTWKPLLDLARERSDVIVNFGNGMNNAAPDPVAPMRKHETWTDEKGSVYSKTIVQADGRELTSLTRRDRDVNTVWTLEHLLKDEDDLRAWLALPERECDYRIDTTYVTDMEERIGDAGIAMPNLCDPVCCVAPLFDMGTWTVMALTEQEMIREALERAHRHLMAQAKLAAREIPGRLWRICGPEYAGEPYLPPHLFHEYVTGYVKEIAGAIQSTGGFARVHSHGRLKNIIDMIAETGCTGLDPIEPPQQGDVELAYVRERVGSQMTLFGNIEITDIENLQPEEFEKKVATALREGPGGRGFVLMPSACPYGWEITPLCLRNYELMIEMAEAMA